MVMIIMIYVMISFVFWRYGAGARVEDDGLNNYPESWHDADEPAEKCIERPMEPVFFLSFLALIPNCSRKNYGCYETNRETHHVNIH